MALITVPYTILLGKTEDKQGQYYTCSYGKNSESKYWIERAPAATQLKIGADTFQYQQETVTTWKYPDKSAKYPLRQKPYSVGRSVLYLKHGTYTLRQGTQVCLVQRYAVPYHGPANKQCTNATAGLIQNKREVTLQRAIDPRPLAGQMELQAANHFSQVKAIERLLATNMAAKLYNKADGDYDFLTELAEAKQSVETLASIASAILTKRGRKAILKAMRSKGKQRNKHVANNILLGQYGLAPMYYSYLDVRKALENIGRKKFRSRSSETIATKLPNGSIETNIVVTGVAFVSQFAAIPGILNRFRFNPLLTIWEKIPYSFVVDWFTNIGDILGALQPALNPLYKIEGSIGIKVTTKISVEGNSAQPEDKVQYDTWTSGVWPDAPPVTYKRSWEEYDGYTPPRAAKEIMRFERIVLSPRLLNFNWDNGFSEWKAIISAALLTQRS